MYGAIDLSSYNDLKKLGLMKVSISFSYIPCTVHIILIVKCFSDENTANFIPISCRNDHKVNIKQKPV